MIKFFLFPDKDYYKYKYVQDFPNSIKKWDREGNGKFFRVEWQVGTNKFSAKGKNLEGFLEVAIENWPEWDLNPQPLNTVQTI